MYFFKKKIQQDASDESLMQAIIKGNKLAFELLYERYFNNLIYFVMPYVHDKETAQDIVQEVFIKIILKPELFDSSKKFSTWVYTIAGNAAKNSIRENSTKMKRNEIYAKHLSHQSVPQVAIDSKILEQEFANIYASLKSKEQEVFHLRFQKDLSIKEIANQLSIPEGSVKSCLYYILKKHSNILNYYKNEK